MNFQIAVEEWELYNNGILACKWFDVSQDTIEGIEEYFTELKEEHGLGDDLELFIADYECDIDLDIDESHPERAFSLYEKIEDLDEDDLIKLEFLMSNCGYDLDEALSNIEDTDLYMDTNLVDLAYDFVEEGLFGEIEESIRNYIDYEAIARDLSFDYTEWNGHVLRAA